MKLSRRVCVFNIVVLSSTQMKTRNAINNVYSFRGRYWKIHIEWAGAGSFSDHVLRHFIIISLVLQPAVISFWIGRADPNSIAIYSVVQPILRRQWHSQAQCETVGTKLRSSSSHYWPASWTFYRAYILAYLFIQLEYIVFTEVILGQAPSSVVPRLQLKRKSHTHPLCWYIILS